MMIMMMMVMMFTFISKNVPALHCWEMSNSNGEA